MNENTEVLPLDAVTLEVRYYDDGRPGRYRCWTIPLHEARDIARWWAKTGPHAGAARPPRDAQRVGSVLVSFTSATHVYAVGCDKLGRPNITGYQLPQAAVGFLGAWLDQHLGSLGPAAATAATAAARSAPAAAEEAVG